MRLLRFSLFVLIIGASIFSVSAQDRVTCDSAFLESMLADINAQLGTIQEQIDNDQDPATSIQAAQVMIDAVTASCFAEDMSNIEATDGEMVIYENEAVSIQIPADWLDMTDPAIIEASLEMFSALSPDSQGVVDTLTAQGMSGAVDFLFMNPSNFSTVVVVAQDLGSSLDLTALEPAILAQFESLGFTILNNTTVEIPAGPAIYVELSFEIAPGNSQTQQAYIMAYDTSILTVNLGATTSIYEDEAPLFDAIIQSLVIK